MQVILTQRISKARCADLIRAAKRANGWTNTDAGDAMGCCEGTVRNRLDDDTPKDQMTVYELARLIAACDPKAIGDELAALGLAVLS